MTYSELKKLLRKNGCRYDHEGGNHEIWYSPVTNAYFPIGRHKTEEVRPGTLRSVLNAAGISRPQQ